MSWDTARKAALVVGLIFMGIAGWAFGVGHLRLSLISFMSSLAILISVIDNPEP